MRMLAARKIVNETTSALKIEDVVAAGARDAMINFMNKAVVLGSVSRNLELALPGGIVQLVATATPLADDDGRRTGWVIVLEDITELVRMEKIAAWQEVARRLAHEIKNPLTPIRLSAERILHRYEQLPTDIQTALPKAAREKREHFGQLLADCIQTILQEADSLKNLVDEFSRFARMPEKHPENVDLNAIIENTLQLYAGRMDDMRILKELDRELPLLCLDQEQMKRVFINLFDNAIESMSATTQETGRKTLRIHTFLDKIQGTVRIEVSDNGCGFPTQYRDSMFLPYFSTRKGGTGLGLAIARQIIADHHGSIRAEVNTPVGARIIIDLPLSQPQLP